MQDESGRRKIALHEKVLTEYLGRFPRNLELLSYFLKQGLPQRKRWSVRSNCWHRRPPKPSSDNRFWRFKGWVHAAQRQYPLAEAAYRHALQLNPYDWHSQHELADVMRKLKKHAQVEVLQAQALEGKELRKAIMQLPNVQDIPTPTPAAHGGLCRSVRRHRCGRQPVPADRDDARWLASRCVAPPVKAECRDSAIADDGS